MIYLSYHIVNRNITKKLKIKISCIQDSHNSEIYANNQNINKLATGKINKCTRVIETCNLNAL